MERREFVGATIATACTAAVGVGASSMREPQELYERRVYVLPGNKRTLLDDYLSKAFLPAAKRAGVGPIGVFTEEAEKGGLKIHVLLVHKSADSVTELHSRLATDGDHRTAAAEYLAARPDQPAYERIESSLLSAITGMPKLARPDVSKPRFLNLRIYESHNERAAAKKVEMFEQGELAIFRRVGLTPVFFASCIIGAAMPNLTYALVFPDEAGRKGAWDKFRNDPEWLKLKAIPGYADKEIVSRITNLILKPTSYSEI